MASRAHSCSSTWPNVTSLAATPRATNGATSAASESRRVPSMSNTAMRARPVTGAANRVDVSWLGCPPMVVDYELNGHVAVITINRPEARNAVNGDVAEGVEAAIDRLEETDEAWVGILTGA